MLCDTLANIVNPQSADPPLKNFNGWLSNVESTTPALRHLKLSELIFPPATDRQRAPCDQAWECRLLPRGQEAPPAHTGRPQPTCSGGNDCRHAGRRLVGKEVEVELQVGRWNGHAPRPWLVQAGDTPTMLQGHSINHCDDGPREITAKRASILNFNNIEIFFSVKDKSKMKFSVNFNGLLQDCSISIFNALEILQPCTNPSI